MAALGLVHVVRGDQHGQAARGERVDLVPEIAARLRIDAGGRFVEQQQLAARGSGRRPAPAAASSRRRVRRRADAARAREAEPVERRIDLRPRSAMPYIRATKSQILADGQVLVEAEPLRHVADVPLDRLGLADDVVAQAGAAAGVGRAAARRACGWTSSCRCRWDRGSRRSRRGAPRASGPGRRGSCRSTCSVRGRR